MLKTFVRNCDDLQTGASTRFQAVPDFVKVAGPVVFTDCLDLKPGEQYKTRLLNEILARDLFVLFWSENARQSKWVEWEYVTVLDFKGEEPVRINPLQPEVPPPTRLSHLHFGSRAAWYSAASSG